MMVTQVGINEKYTTKADKCMKIWFSITMWYPTRYPIQEQKIRDTYICTPNITLTREQGFEPRSATLKAAVLPLNHSPE